MAYIKSNNFTTCPYNIMGVILLLLQTNGPGMAELLGLPENLITWLTTCYDVWSAKRVQSGAESGEKNVAYENYQFKFIKVREMLVMIRDLIEALVRDLEHGQDILTQYGFIGPTPTNREDISNLIGQIKLTSDTLRAAGDPNVVAESIITKLVEGNTELTSLWLTAQEESQDADQTYDELQALYEEAGQKLGLIHKYAVLVMGPYSPDLQLLGFAPETPPAGHGQPIIPADFVYTLVPPNVVFSWTPCPNATSYQLVFSLDGDEFEELYSGSEAEFSYQPPVGKRYYKVRARNAYGFSEFSELIEYTVPEVPE